MKGPNRQSGGDNRFRSSGVNLSLLIEDDNEKVLLVEIEI